MTPDLSIKKKPWRIWRWLRRIALSLVLLCVLVILSLWVRLLWEESQGKKELATVVAQTDEKDPRWRWEEIQEDLPPIPDEENSALVIQKVVNSWGQSKPTASKLPNGKWLLEERPPANVRLDEQHLGLLREELGRLEPAVALAVSLKDFPRGRTPIQLTDDIISTPLPHVQPTREVVGFLELDNERLLHAGRLDEIPDRIQAILRTGASLRDDHSLIGALVRIALRYICVRRIERTLAMGQLSDGKCRMLATLLDEEHSENLVLPALRGERASLNYLFENCRSGKVSLAQFHVMATNGSGKPNVLQRLGSFAYSYRLPEDQAFLLNWMNDLCDIARLPVEEQSAEWATCDSKIRASRQVSTAEFRWMLSHLLLPNAYKVGEANVRVQANLRCAITALAAERFRLANKRWPKTLDELCPRYLPSVPLDPYTGDPLLLAVREDGIVIYSVGKDGIDDGGDVTPPRTNQMSADYGFRLYNLDQRNLPPLLPEEPKDD